MKAKAKKPNKVTKEQLEMLIGQTKMFKDYFSNIEACHELGKHSLMLFPFMPTEHMEEHFDSVIEQANIYSNYFAMTEMYLGLIHSNLDWWDAMYIHKKPVKKK